VGDFFGDPLSLPVNNSWQPNKEKKMNRPKLIKWGDIEMEAL
jgi:hypothetical protein